MRDNLFVAGVIILGITLIYFMPRGYKKSWRTTGFEPLPARLLLLLLQIFGLGFLIIASLIILDIVTVDSIIKSN
ncbi:MAG: hypothetical protein ACN4E2_01115 [Nitrospinota bacterium]